MSCFVLRCERVSYEIAVAVAGDDHGIATCVFRDIHNGKSAVFFYIGFGAGCLDLDQLFLGVLLTAAGIDVFNKNFVFVDFGIPLNFMM